MRITFNKNTNHWRKLRKNKDKRLYRILNILNKLQTGKSVTTLELAHEYNVDRRSILRDLNALDEAGFALKNWSIRGFREGREMFWELMGK